MCSLPFVPFALSACELASDNVWFPPNELIPISLIAPLSVSSLIISLVFSLSSNLPSSLSLLYVCIALSQTSNGILPSFISLAKYNVNHSTYLSISPSISVPANIAALPIPPIANSPTICCANSVPKCFINTPAPCANKCEPPVNAVIVAVIATVFAKLFNACFSFSPIGFPANKLEIPCPACLNSWPKCVISFLTDGTIDFILLLIASPILLLTGEFALCWLPLKNCFSLSDHFEILCFIALATTFGFWTALLATLPTPALFASVVPFVGCNPFDGASLFASAAFACTPISCANWFEVFTNSAIGISITLTFIFASLPLVIDCDVTAAHLWWPSNT